MPVDMHGAGLARGTGALALERAPTSERVKEALLASTSRTAQEFIRAVESAHTNLSQTECTAACHREGGGNNNNNDR